MGKYNAIKENITQVVLIVFSVVLGLYLSERIEERKTKRESENLLARVKSEVNNNIKLVEDWALYHQEIHKNLDSLSQDDEFIEEFIKDEAIFFEKLMTRGTFMGRQPASDAWDIAKAHPLIVNMDYDKILILSKIYNQQKSTFTPMLKMFDILNSTNVNIKKDAKSNLESISKNMHELVAREKQLMYYYNKSKEILDLHDNEDIDN